MPAGFVAGSSGLLTDAGFATEAVAEDLPCAAAAGFAEVAVGVFGASCDVHHDLDVVFPASLRIEIERTGCNELVSLPSRPWPHVIQSR